MFNTPQKKHLGIACNNNMDSKSRFFPEEGMNRSVNGKKIISGKKPSLQQTKLCWRKSLNCVGQLRESNVNESSFCVEQKAELFVMPLPNKKYVSTNGIINKKLRLVESKPESEVSVQQNDNHKLQAMIGNVDFVINTMNAYKSINLLWSVYAKLLKITDGKVRFEKNLLLRNTTGKGPVLQCIYFDLKYLLNAVESGCYVCVVGQITTGNKLRAHKIKFLNEPPDERLLCRIQNVNLFTLQKYNNNNIK